MLQSIRRAAGSLLLLTAMAGSIQAAVAEKTPQLKDYKIDFSQPWDNAADIKQLDRLLNGRMISQAEHACSISSKPNIMVFADGVVYLNETYTSYDVYSIQAVEALGCKI